MVLYRNANCIKPTLVATRFQNLGEMMTLGRNDAAVSPNFIDGLTLDGPIGHAGKVLFVTGPFVLSFFSYFGYLTLLWPGILFCSEEDSLLD